MFFVFLARYQWYVKLLVYLLLPALDGPVFFQGSDDVTMIFRKFSSFATFQP